MYIKRYDFDIFEESEDLGKESEIELEKSEIRGQVLQITEPRMENNKNQNSQNRKQQNIPAVPWKPQIYIVIDHNIKSLMYRDPTHTLQS